MRGLGKFHQWCANFYMVARLGHQTRDVAGPWRGNFHHRLVGLDGSERLVGHHMIAGVHLPRQELSLGQPFPQIGQVKYASAAVRHQWNSMAFRAAETIRSASGKYHCSSRGSGLTVS